jgi:uncharacterized protein YbjT (DUF2867 family)
MSILIVGATGLVGGEIAHKLAKHGNDVVAFVRGGRIHSKADELLSAGIGIIEGDLTSAETLAKAVEDSEVVVCTATSMPSAANDGLRRVDHDGILALIEAAEAEGVKKFIYVSFSGNIQEDSPLKTAKRECENRLLASRMEVVIVRPSYFMEVWLSPALGFDPTKSSVRIYGSGDAKVSYVSASNVSDFGALAATKTYPDKKTILEIGGPEPLSQLDMIRIVEKEWKKRMKTDCVPTEALESLHKSSDPLQKTFAALMLAYSKGDVVVGASSLAHQHAIKLQSVAEYASKSRDLHHG